MVHSVKTLVLYKCSHGLSSFLSAPIFRQVERDYLAEVTGIAGLRETSRIYAPRVLEMVLSNNDSGLAIGREASEINTHSPKQPHTMTNHLK